MPVTCDLCDAAVAEDDYLEVDGRVTCHDCRDTLRTCDGCQEPMIDWHGIDGDETHEYVVCSHACAELVRQDVGCHGCGRIPDDVRDLNDVNHWDADSQRWEGGLYCDACR